MEGSKIVACAAVAALAAPAAVYAGMEFAEMNNDQDVARCAAVLGDVATIAATPPQECLPNEASEYNGFTYHVTKSTEANAVTTTAYYDIPSVEAYMQVAVGSPETDLTRPFSTRELGFYLFVGGLAATVVYAPSRAARKTQEAEADLQPVE